MKRLNRLALATLFAFAASFGYTQSAFAECKGKSASACKSDSDCVWVGGYMRKGKKVASYCRSKPSKSAFKKKAKKEYKKDRKKKVRKEYKKKDYKKKVKKEYKKKDKKKKVAKKAKKKRKKYNRKKKKQ